MPLPPNVLAPLGFCESHRLGAAPNYQLSRRWINPSNPTPIFKGDPVMMTATGYLTVATPGTQAVSGIFNGCEYMSTSRRLISPFPWWSGSGDAVAGVGVSCIIVDDPMMVFRVQANGQVTQAMVGMNATFALGTGNTGTGISGAMLDVVTTPPAATATLPFRIVDLITDPPGGPGTDLNSPYNWVFVTFNNQDFRAGQLGV